LEITAYDSWSAWVKDEFAMLAGLRLCPSISYFYLIKIFIFRKQKVTDLATTESAVTTARRIFDGDHDRDAKL
jgi:hypothetical protein